MANATKKLKRKPNLTTITLNSLQFFEGLERWTQVVINPRMFRKDPEENIEYAVSIGSRNYTSRKKHLNY
jgi:hypothetical protein